MEVAGIVIESLSPLSQGCRILVSHWRWGFPEVGAPIWNPNIRICPEKVVFVSPPIYMAVEDDCSHLFMERGVR